MDLVSFITTTSVIALVLLLLLLNEADAFLFSKMRKRSTVSLDSPIAPPNMENTAEEDEIGLALAGGSLRASSTCYGVMRGFQQKSLKDPSTSKDVPAMNLVKYVSGCSGGSIPAVLYTYAGVPVDELLETDRTTDPSKITAEELSRMPKTSMGYVLARKPGVYLILLRSAFKLLTSPWNLLKVHSIFPGGLYKKFFKPLKMPKNKLMISSKDELNEILARNPQLEESDFLLPRNDVKALPMILTTMHGPRADFNKYETNYKAIVKKAWEEYRTQESNMTDLVQSLRDEFGSNLPMPYVITPGSVENMYHGEVQIKDKKVQFPENNVRPLEWGVQKGNFGRRNRFSAEFLTSLSANFPGSAQSTMSLFLTGLRKIPLSNDSGTTLRFADGGTNDLFGLIPLVSRGTKNIISVYNFNQNRLLPSEYVHVNQNFPLVQFNNTYAEIYEATQKCTSRDDPDFDTHFKTWLKHINPRFTCFFGYFAYGAINHANIMNHVFDDKDLERLKELMVKYNSLFKAGEPLIATLKDLEVIDNPFWGVKGGKKVNLTLMWFNLPEKFSSQIPSDVADFSSEEFKVIPELKVEPPTAAFKYTPKQVNMMGYLGSWMVEHSWDGLKGSDGEVLFDGFANIFDKEQTLESSKSAVLLE